MIATGQQIRAARAALGWSQEDLAQRAGLHPKSIGYWEHAAPAEPRRRAMAPERIVAAFRAAGVEIATEPRPAVFFSDARAL